MPEEKKYYLAIAQENIEEPEDDNDDWQMEEKTALTPTHVVIPCSYLYAYLANQAITFHDKPIHDYFKLYDLFSVLKDESDYQIVSKEVIAGGEIIPSQNGVSPRHISRLDRINIGGSYQGCTRKVDWRTKTLTASEVLKRITKDNLKFLR